MFYHTKCQSFSFSFWGSRKGTSSPRGWCHGSHCANTKLHILKGQRKKHGQNHGTRILKEDQAFCCPSTGYRSYKEKALPATHREERQRERKGRCKYILAMRKKKEFHTAIKCIVLLSFWIIQHVAFHVLFYRPIHPDLPPLLVGWYNLAGRFSDKWKRNNNNSILCWLPEVQHPNVWEANEATHNYPAEREHWMAL